MDAFTTTAAPQATNSRYDGITRTVPSPEGGQVGVGVSKRGQAFLVHKLPRSEEAIALGAVASAITGDIIPLDALVKAFAESKRLPALVKAVEAASK
jgi:hypothetical protein